MKDFAKVEIYNPSRLRAFINMKSNNPYKHDPDGGVISILTTRGFGSFDDTFIRPIQGRITPTVTGFRQAREFYSPEYPLVNDTINKPDQRPTLFWDPYVMLNEGKASVKFFTSDMPGKYLIIADGVSDEGKVCSGITSFEVVATKD